MSLHFLLPKIRDRRNVALFHALEKCYFMRFVFSYIHHSCDWNTLRCKPVFTICLHTFFNSRCYYRKRGSASYVREVHSVREREIQRERERERERERKRERRKWRHHCRAKIRDEWHFPFAKNSRNWRWVYTFLCQKFALLVSPFTLPVSPFTERSPLWRWNSQWVHTFRCQKSFRPLCSHTFRWREPRDEWSKTQDQRSNPAQSFIIGNAEAFPILERDTERERRKWRHHCRAKIGDEFCTSPCQKCAP